MAKKLKNDLTDVVEKDTRYSSNYQSTSFDWKIPRPDPPSCIYPGKKDAKDRDYFFENNYYCWNIIHRNDLNLHLSSKFLNFPLEINKWKNGLFQQKTGHISFPSGFS